MTTIPVHNGKKIDHIQVDPINYPVFSMFKWEPFTGGIPFTIVETLTGRNTIMSWGTMFLLQDEFRRN